MLATVVEFDHRSCHTVAFLPVGTAGPNSSSLLLSSSSCALVFGSSSSGAGGSEGPITRLRFSELSGVRGRVVSTVLLGGGGSSSSALRFLFAR